jgi:DNA-binding NtrC family response regulator
MISGFNIKVLVVDDEQFILDSLTGFLEDFEFQVFRAESGESALKLLEKESINAVVIDLRLPGMAGDTLIRKINCLYPNIRFVIHTGSVGYVLSEDLKSIGMKTEHIFFKPVPDLTTLVETVLTLVNETIEE